MIVIFIQLLQSYCQSTTIMEPKNADMIYCVDNRGEEPRYLIFNLMMDEIYNLEDSKFFGDNEVKVESPFEIEKIKLMLDDERPLSERMTFEDLNDDQKRIWTEYRDAKMKQLIARNTFIYNTFPKKVDFVPEPQEGDYDYEEKKELYDRYVAFQ